jgi:hypothetical protein
MSEIEWRGRINQILYGLIYTPALDDQVATQMAEAMQSGRYFLDGAQTYREAITAALDSDATISDGIDTPHSEEQFRSFLGRLRDKLGAAA